MCSCWAVFYNCLPRCMQSSCCAPATRNVSFVTAVQTIHAVAAPTLTRTPPPSPKVDAAKLPRVLRIQAEIPNNRPATPDPEMDGAVERVAHIHARQDHNRLASAEIVSMNTFIHEKKEGKQ